ncbi:MAG: peptidoglycan DD-metalloendopeptidase family protein [Crocinitomicaceae bacterium]|jgi:murein hydrolase activator|nr:peptidoglycan DD-metalloendopeptidase family protein [Crocinitomicaceae bacterium]MDP4866159.1 peptidoglycan DD-metalloendopeptidase family protein [Crocinitomicaceae bacterium]
MKNVSKLLFLFVLLVVSNYASAQSSEKLKTEQDRLAKKISNTKSLLDKVKTNTEASLNELKIIDKQIQFREDLVRNFDNQIRGAESKISEKDKEIVKLTDKLGRLKKQYKKLLIYAYKHRNKYGQLMYIFSSGSYFEAIKRNNYLKRVSEMQHKQFLIILQHQGLIKNEIQTIQKEKEYKVQILDEKKIERDQIAKDKVKQEVVYKKFKSEEGKLYAQLKEDERKKVELNQKISAAIQKEIAAAEAKRKKAEEAARKKSTTAATTAGGTAPATTTTAEKKETTTFTETKESAALNKSFEGNKGKLPWPVEKGTITEGFGRNNHPTLPNVVTNNNGIDISAPKNAQVRAVFEGEVTSVLNIPGAGKVVIIKHGNYRTVYSNLQDTYVSAGSKVSTKQAIGSLLNKENSSVSLAHFEIHQVVGTVVNCLNPSLWVAN